MVRTKTSQDNSALTMVRHTLAVFLVPEQISEVRAFPTGPRDQPALHKTLYRDHDLMARKATGLDEAAGVYFVPNPIAPAALPAGRPAGGRSVKDDDIACRHWLLVDVDPYRLDAAGKRLEGDHPSSDSERESAWQAASRCRELCEGAGLTNTVLADSGNGWHLCWPIDLPNDQASYSLVDSFLAGLQKRCGDGSSYIDPKVKNASRIWKLYGTTARKGPATEDRPHRESRLIEGEPWNALAAAANNAALARLIALWQAQDTLWGQRGGSQTRPDAYARCLEYLAKCDPAVSGQSGHDKLLWAARCAVLGFDLGPDAGFRALKEAYNQRCTPPWSDKELQHKCKEADTKPFGRLRGWLLEDGEPSRASASEKKSSGTRSEQATPTNGQAPRRLCLICAADVEMRPTEWLVPEFIARGGLNVIGGDGGFGKSSLTIHLAAQLSQGEPCFGLNYQTKGPTRTLLIGCEDSRSATVVPRLAAAGAVLKNINFVDDILVGETDRVSFVLSPSGLEALEQAIIKLGDVSCVVIDPVSAFLADKIDDHKDSDVRRMLRPLAELAERLNIAIVLVKHLNKSDSGNSGNLVSGSRAYVNASRAAFLVGPDPSDDADEDRRVLVFSKRNLTKRWKGLAFRAVPLDEDQAAVVLIMPQAAGLSDEDREALRGQLFRLEWLGETDATDSDLAKARRGKDNAGGRNKRIAECGEWLLQFLADGRKRLSDDVKSAAISAGFSDKILFDAKKANSAIRASNKGEARGKWYWWFEEKRPPGSTPFTGTAT